MDDENIMISKMLQKCKKTAVIMPAYLCRDHKRKLAQQNLAAEIGKEEYTINHVTYLVTGFVQKGLLKRIKLLSSSGMLEWWLKIMNHATSYEDMVFGDNRNKIGDRNMIGNVVVIFLVLGSGLLMGLVCYCAEDYRWCRKKVSGKCM